MDTMEEQAPTQPPAFKATATRDDGGWLVHIPRLDVSSRVRTLDEVDAMARRLVVSSLGFDGPEIIIEVSTELPSDISDDLAEVARWRDISGYAASRVAMLTRKSADLLVGREHLTQRETAQLLGVSQQRVAQLLKKPE
ncbi:MAG: hypothetical protein FWF75_05325 [Propionibacteriaceae bacterium]|nr:hypothetical protein [Propionibacteriaceae bacterium]